MAEPLVQTQTGQVRGIVKQSCVGFDYCAFLGIPYAKPPVGDLRFQDPQPCEKWSGIRDAKEYGSKCYQYNVILRTFSGSEDCLYHNVFVRSLENVHVKKPVMFWIHGGAFNFGSGSDEHFGPDYLLQKDIVLVTFNYRLGVFGFLNLEHELAPGNQGLKDQVMALQWVHDNIANFGGDPNNVTIFGESAGSVCAHYLALSPLTKGLFHKLICQSGSGLNTWARLRNPKLQAIKLCQIMGKYFQDPKSVLAFLKKVDGGQLVKAQEEERKSKDIVNLLHDFGPGVDDKSKNPLMPIPIEIAALKGVDVPFLIGYNNVDGVSYLIGFKTEIYDYIDRFFTKWMIPGGTEVLDRYNLTNDELKEMYFTNGKITAMERLKLANLATDLHFIEGIHKTIKVQVEKKTFPTYAYVFTCDEPVTLSKGMFPHPIPGAAHFDEIEYLFCPDLRKQLGYELMQKNTPAYRTMERMVEMWTNFATHGSPTPRTSELVPVEWLPVDDGTSIRYLNINSNLVMETGKNIEEKYRRFANLISLQM